MGLESQTTRGTRLTVGYPWRSGQQRVHGNLDGHPGHPGPRSRRVHTGGVWAFPESNLAWPSSSTRLMGVGFIFVLTGFEC